MLPLAARTDAPPHRDLRSRGVYLRSTAIPAITIPQSIGSFYGSTNDNRQHKKARTASQYPVTNTNPSATTSNISTDGLSGHRIMARDSSAMTSTDLEAASKADDAARAQNAHCHIIGGVPFSTKDFLFFFPARGNHPATHLWATQSCLKAASSVFTTMIDEDSLPLPMPTPWHTALDHAIDKLRFESAHTLELDANDCEDRISTKAWSLETHGHAQAYQQIRYIVLRQASPLVYSIIIDWTEKGTFSKPGVPPEDLGIFFQALYGRAKRLEIMDLAAEVLERLRSAIRIQDVLTLLFSAEAEEHAELRQILAEYAQRHWSAIKHQGFAADLVETARLRDTKGGQARAIYAVQFLLKMGSTPQSVQE